MGKIPGIDGLAVFSRSVDRQLTPFFSGRTDLIGAVEMRAMDVFNAWRSGHASPAAGAMLVIQGAPGAGKTALLDFLRARWNAPDHPIAVRVDDDGVNTPSVLTAILREVNPGKARALAKGSGRRVEVRGAVPGVAVAGVKETTTPPLSEWRGLKEALGRRAWRRPVCLLIDEAQGLDESARTLLRALHMANHGLPIVPVLAGLAYTTERLRELGISRLAVNGVRTLTPLSEEEATESVAKFLDHFRVAGAAKARREWTQAVVEDAQGWPQHLHVGLQAAARELAAHGGDLSRSSLNTARTGAKTMRWDYYEARTTQEMRRSKRLLAAAMAVLGDGADGREEIAEILDGHVRDELGWRLPGGMTSLDFVNHLVVAGVLQDAGRRVYCPIPSFCDHLADPTGRRSRGPAPPKAGFGGP